MGGTEKVGKLLDLETPGKVRTLLRNFPGGSFLANLILLTRAYDWFDKLWLLTGSALFLVAASGATDEGFRVLTLFFLYSLFGLTYGYSLNSYADREEDADVGKDRGIQYFKKWQLVSIYGFLSAGLIGIPLSFLRADLAFLGLVNFFLATFYSLRPIRLKERGFLALMASAIGERPLGFMFVVLLVRADPQLEIILLFWLGVLGLMGGVSHQILDYSYDIQTSTKTWATDMTNTTIRGAMKVMLGLSIFAICSPILAFQDTNGLAYCLILAAFSTQVYHYFLEAYQHLLSFPQGFGGEESKV